MKALSSIEIVALIKFHVANFTRPDADRLAELVDDLKRSYAAEAASCGGAINSAGAGLLGYQLARNNPS
jgi:hypothetical protein